MKNTLTKSYLLLNSMSKQPGFATVLIAIAAWAGLILFVPMPLYQKGYCNEMYPPICYPAGWKLKTPLWQEILGIPTQTVSHTLTSPSPIPTSSDETANWKMFTNTKYGYSIKHPDNWYDAGSYDGDWYFDQVFSNTPVDKPSPSAQSIRVRVIKRVGPAWKDTKVYFDEIYNDPNGSHFLIDNVPATKIIEVPGKEKATEPYYSINAYAYKNGRVYRIYIIEENKEIAKKIEPVFNQILSTFKF